MSGTQPGEALGFLVFLAVAVFGAGIFAFFYCLVLAGRIRRLEERLEAVERGPSVTPLSSEKLEDLRRLPDESAKADEPALPPVPPELFEDDKVGPTLRKVFPDPDQTRPEPVRAAEPAVVERPAPSGAVVPATTPTLAAPGPSVGARALDLAKTWATTGNVPVKMGVLISLIGLGFLLGVALEQGWITLTIQVRHILVALFGVLLLVVGWRVRGRNPAYGLSLQGGGIAVLYLTTYVAHAVYDLVPASFAAVAVVVITVGAGVLAVLEDARSMAVLGIVGGFIAPVLAYSNARDHVLVFGFYLILSAAVVAVAWFKTWPELNLLGLGFTLGVSAFWLFSRYREVDWATTQPLIALLVFLYLTIPLLFAVRQRLDVRDWTTSPFVFGLPFAGLGLQWILTDHFEYGPAISSGVIAVILGGFAFLAHRLGDGSRSLRDAYVALSVAFVALTVPLALGAQYTSVAWVIQGGVLVWFGVRLQRRLATYGGTILQAMGGLSFIAYLIDRPASEAGDLTPVLNGLFLGAMLLAVVGLFSGRLLDRKGDRQEDTVTLTWLALVWGVGWWIFGGLAETMLHVQVDRRLSVAIVFVTVSLGGLALASPALDWPRLKTVGVALLPALVVFVILALTSQDHPLGRNGWAAWIVALVTYYSVLRVCEGAFPRATPIMHTAGYWVVAILLGTEVHWQVERVSSGAWPISMALLAVLAPAGGTLLSRLALRWPLVVHWRTYVVACSGPVFLALALLALSTNLSSDGHTPPLTYLPLLNPLELVTILVAVGVLAWKKLADEEPDIAGKGILGGNWAPPLTIVGIVLIAMVVARTVHHWSGVPFEFDSMVESTTLQASLSIVWGLGGLSGMVVGVRLARRMVWVGGASLMGLVVIKLFLFDLANTGTLERVVSFLGVGVLLLIVGYLAPVPPSALTQSGETEPQADQEHSDPTPGAN
ncbi:MAG: DUF2339 domain-containing protein [bacterium]|nr:DUF2339 domain-containing protein [bacterium]